MNRRNLKKLSIQYRRLFIMTGLTLALLLVGVLGLMYFEHYVLFDAIWVMIISVMTIGYGDIYPVTDQGRVFALLLVPAGAAVISYGLGSVGSYFLEKHFPEKVWEKRMQRELKKLSGHVIICGSGIVAQQVYKQLTAEQAGVDVLFISEEASQLSETLDADVLRLIENPADNQVLQRARLGEARALVAAMEQDSENVFITLTAKSLNETIEVSAIAAKEDSEEILRRAGANYVITPSVIGGRELAMSVLRPSGAAYIHELLSTESEEFSVGEISLDENPALNGKTLADLSLRSQDQVIPVAISRDGRLISSPEESYRLTTDDVLLILGKRKDIEQLQQRLQTSQSV